MSTESSLLMMKPGEMRSLLTFGYIKTNYHKFLPEVIIKICLLYFDEDHVYRIRGKSLSKLLSASRYSFTQPHQIQSRYIIHNLYMSK